MIILHNPLDADSRAFVISYGEGHTVVDWYGDRNGYSGPAPSAFPSVVKIDADGGPIIIRSPTNMDDAEAKISAVIKTRVPTFAQAASSLTAGYKADITNMQLSWVSVAVTGGFAEATKKAAIVADIAARKSQFSADYAALKSSYGV